MYVSFWTVAAYIYGDCCFISSSLASGVRMLCALELAPFFCPTWRLL